MNMDWPVQLKIASLIRMSYLLTERVCLYTNKIKLTYNLDAMICEVEDVYKSPEL